MKNDLRYLIIAVCLFISGVVSVHAEVVLDGKMGTDGQINGPDYNIRAEYGRQAGANLFHSFSQFNINTNESANFRVSPAIQNIISRVTGGTSSWIDGPLRSTISGTSEISGANLYLLNPGGVVFGPNASLNIGGSFYVTTADYLRMGEYERFHATQDNEVLSAEPPSAFGFLDSMAGKIAFEGHAEDGKNPASLAVSKGKSISLIGGNIEITGDPRYEESGTGNLNAPEGRINMASVASPGEVIPTESGLDVSLFRELGDIKLSEDVYIRASGEGSGDIFIRCGQFFADKGSTLEADTTGNRDGGITDIQADTLLLSNSRIFSDTKGKGRGGNISLQVAESVTLSDESRIFADATGEGSETGSAGAVSIKTKTLSLSDSSIVSSETYGKSSGGRVVLLAKDSINISSGEIFARSVGNFTETDAGTGGTILLETRYLSLSGKESKISSDTYKDGKGGNITVSGPGKEFAESVTISEGSIYAGTEGTGDGGTVLVETKNLLFTDSGEINSESFGQGRGGDIAISASENILLKNQGKITTNTNGPGDAGVITLEAAGLELSENASISSASPSSGGNTGDAGVIRIQVSDSMYLSGNSAITTQAEDAGKGEININVGGRLYSSDSKITTSIKKGEEDAGNINTEQDVLILRKSDIVANAWEGRGGNIHIIAEPFIQSPDSLVDASSQFGMDGTVYIESPDDDVSSVTVLPTRLLDATRWLKVPCAARLGENMGSFVITGRDAVPDSFLDIQAATPLMSQGLKSLSTDTSYMAPYLNLTEMFGAEAGGLDVSGTEDENACDTCD